MSFVPLPSVDRVKRYREKHGVGMIDATRSLLKEDRQARLSALLVAIEDESRPSEAIIRELIILLRELV